MSASWYPLSPEQLDRLTYSISSMVENYDATERMVTVSVEDYSPGYNTGLTTGTAHVTRESMYLALAWLDTGDDDNLDEACEIMRVVLPLQETDTSFWYYGTWPYFLEESLSEMTRADMNWADFIGITLLQIYRDHSTRLPSDVLDLVTTATTHAATGSKIRDVSPYYTNVNIMGTYVALIYGETFGESEFVTYGEGRIKELFDYTLENGGFLEYNSPPYNNIVVIELSRLYTHMESADYKDYVRSLLRLMWEDVATHHHVPTRQWAGPFARAYQTLSYTHYSTLISRGTQGNIIFSLEIPDREEFRITLDCPSDYWHFFQRLDSPRTVMKMWSIPLVKVGTTYLHDSYCLGTINYGDMWTQRRNVLVYFNNDSAPMFFQVRLLKDDFDFASAYISTKVYEGNVTGLLTFINNGTDRTLSDYLTNGSFTAEKIVMRFEIGGDSTVLESCSITQSDGQYVFSTPTISFALHVPYAKWDTSDGTTTTSTSTTDETIGVDVVLYEGTSQEFNLKSISKAIVAFGLSVNSTTTGTVTYSEGTTTTTITHEGRTLTLPFQPITSSERIAIGTSM